MEISAKEATLRRKEEAKDEFKYVLMHYILPLIQTKMSLEFEDKPSCDIKVKLVTYRR